MAPHPRALLSFSRPPLLAHWHTVLWCFLSPSACCTYDNPTGSLGSTHEDPEFQRSRRDIKATCCAADEASEGWDFGSMQKVDLRLVSQQSLVPAGAPIVFVQQTTPAQTTCPGRTGMRLLALELEADTNVRVGRSTVEIAQGLILYSR